MDIRNLENELAKFIYELETEHRLVRVGLKEKLESEKVYKKYKNLYDVKNLLKIKKEIEIAKSKDKEILERIYFILVDSFIGQKTSEISDKIATYFSQAKVKVNNEELAYFDLDGRIAKDPIFEKREIYDEVKRKIRSNANPKQLKLLKEDIKLIKSLGFDGYLPYYSFFKKVDYYNFSKVVLKVKKETDKVWEQSASRVSKDVLGVVFKKIKACHLLHLRSLSMFDNFYDKNKVVPAFKKLASDMGIADLLSQVHIDSEDRPKKVPRAVCFWPDPPNEIHLIIKPIGGEQDFEAMFHEGGHALHGAAVSDRLPYAYKNLPRAHALTEMYAFILEDLVFDPEWLSVNLNVSWHSANKILRQATFVNLMMLRRYLGKFTYEYEMFSKNAFSKGPKLYSKHLMDFTGFVTSGDNWLSDMDGGFYSADYLRAWISAAQVKDYLVRKFGNRWFANEKAGKFWRDLWSQGLIFEPEDVVKKLGYKPFDISYLISGYKSIL